MSRQSRVAIGAYLVGAALILMPLADAMISVSPPHVSDYRWRFGAIGMAVNALLVPSAGLLLLLATAVACGHTMVRKALGALALLGTVAVVAGLVMFALDAIQTRPAVRPEMMTSFTVAGVSAFVKLLFFATTLFVLSMIGIGGDQGRENAPDARRVLVPDSAMRRPT